MQRIAIFGPGGSGKSTLATEIGRRLRIPVYHLDHYYWQPGWQAVPDNIFLERHANLIQGKMWIIEGDFTGALPGSATTADTIIYLDFSKRIYVRQWLKRLWMYRKAQRPDMTPGNPERFDLSYLKYLMRYDRSKKLERINPYMKNKDVFVFKNPKEVKCFLSTLG